MLMSHGKEVTLLLLTLKRVHLETPPGLQVVWWGAKGLVPLDPDGPDSAETEQVGQGETIWASDAFDPLCYYRHKCTKTQICHPTLQQVLKRVLCSRESRPTRFSTVHEVMLTGCFMYSQMCEAVGCKWFYDSSTYQICTWMYHAKIRSDKVCAEQKKKKDGFLIF